MQKLLTFQKKFEMWFPKNYIPLEHCSIENEIKEDWNKRGFIVNFIKKQEGMLISGQLAKANFPLSERIKLQTKINKKKPYVVSNYIKK